jgi:predicted ATPase
MLTRLKVSGFKNLVDVDVRFGPFTCIAGTNGVGKSNLFDAIRFLSNLATYPLREAALKVRDDSDKSENMRGLSGDLRSLFSRTGEAYGDTISFEAEMIIPSTGEDDLGQVAEAKTTFLHYQLTLGYESEKTLSGVSRLVIRKEGLTYINRGEAKSRLGFPHTKAWRDSVISNRRTVEFISTENRGSGGIFIKRHQEGPGHPQPYAADRLMRTVLSSVNAGEAATAALAKREMQSWQLLQLEPSALRRPDPTNVTEAAARLASNGAHLPATLYRLARTGGDAVYARVGNRLSELNEDVRLIQVDRDDKRDLLTVEVIDHSGTHHPAKALSDGTLRFLALTVIEEDDQVSGVLCLEEPENGIHPARIEAMLDLLSDIATSPSEALEEGSQLRQVIINTHSPAVVHMLDIETLIVAHRQRVPDGKGKFRNQVEFAALPGTWRTTVDDKPASEVSKSQLLAYLEPNVMVEESEEAATPQEKGSTQATSKRRLRDLFQHPNQLQLF